MSQPVDLRSDTVTRPSEGMRAAMASARVGDDVFGEDPTVNQLQDEVADLFGVEAALYVPTGTMANQIALKVHTRHGDAVVVGEGAHSYLFESGGPGLISGVMFHTAGSGGLFTAEEMQAACNPSEYHFAPTTLVCVENTHNRAGGRVFPYDDLCAIAGAADARRIAVHLDGARVFNAVVASGISPRKWAGPVDSLSFCLSKALGAPIGSVLLGSRDFIREAHRVRKMLGGGMRQVGILAAGGLYALHHHVDGLAADHEKARRLHEGVASIAGLLPSDAPPETNIVMFGTERGPAEDLVQRAAEAGVLTYAIGPRTIRAVTHRDVSLSDIDRALEAFASVS